MPIFRLQGEVIKKCQQVWLQATVINKTDTDTCYITDCKMQQFYSLKAVISLMDCKC